MWVHRQTSVVAWAKEEGDVVDGPIKQTGVVAYEVKEDFSSSHRKWTDARAPPPSTALSHPHTYLDKVIVVIAMVDLDDISIVVGTFVVAKPARELLKSDQDARLALLSELLELVASEPSIVHPILSGPHTSNSPRNGSLVDVPTSPEGRGASLADRFLISDFSKESPVPRRIHRRKLESVAELASAQ
ncbi:hypothetical protein PMIN01_11791 [Paraphaeosphaeria minitans]|uniref:Uncharacterized protein n=1 Tax=Paraphaeosphaeria minitans TaxID=565426 RepID=A0A9P6G6Z5_9PLEO|nr:hypothetical protein PMIN01_11791 [Paraphaeosphaeria minitans]